MNGSSRRLCSVIIVSAVLLWSFSSVVAPAEAQGVGPTAEAAGIVLQSLSSEDLDAVEQQVGYRVGVYVAEVKAGSAAAAAGIKAKDIIIIIGETGVDSTEAAAAAIKAASGTVEVMAFTSSDEGYTPKTYSLDLSGVTSNGAGGAAEGVYRDPQGRFELQPPEGWAVEASENGQGLTLTHGKTAVTVMALAGSGTADELLGAIGGQVREQTKDYQEVRRGERKIAGQSAPLIEFTGVNPQGDAAHSEITACVTPGMGYVFLLSAPEGEFAPAQLAWRMLLASFKVGGTGGGTAAATGVGWQLQTLDKDSLDKIEQATGHRVGVLVTGVAPDSPAAKAGIQAKDILLVVGKTGVDSAQAVEGALAGQSGSVEVLAMRPGKDKFDPVQCTITLRSGTTPSGSIGPTAVAEGDPVNAYFNMMDFIHTEAWGRRVTTSAGERQRVTALLEQDRGQMSAEALEAIEQLPQTWAGLQKQWAGASKEKKDAQRDYWRKQLLVPSQLFIPPEEQETFRGSSDRVVFNYPKGWITAQTESEGTQYLYLGPPKTEASWDRVINASTSPPGALFVVMPIPEEMKSLNSYLDGARAIAQQYVTAGGEFQEIDTLELGQDGAIITLLGHFPGEKEERFFWVGNVRYGPDNIFVGRLGGPVDQAETLVPAFGNVLTSMELNPPGGAGGDEYGAAMVDYYAARAGSIATSGPW